MSDYEDFLASYTKEELEQKLKELANSPLVKKLVKIINTPNAHIGRNEPCPCGSGKKFKKCCRILN